MADDSLLRPGAVALVTGASAGIGEAIAETLAGRGCRVICAARRRDRLDALVARLGEGCRALRLDVTDAEATAGLIDALPEDFREIDILVNNVGHDIGGRRRFDLGAMDEWAGIIDANVTGMVRVSHAVIPGMVARGRGHVINMGSISGFKPYPGGTLYNASKFAVHGFSEALRADYADGGIRVTEIMPGTVRTDFAEIRLHGDEAGAAAFYDGYPAVLAPGDVARCVVFALDQPAGVVVSQLVVMPQGQW
ncbi:MAG: SDR family oxidoreductase [Alphaproteobacteria bacterium]